MRSICTTDREIWLFTVSIILALIVFFHQEQNVDDNKTSSFQRKWVHWAHLFNTLVQWLISNYKVCCLVFCSSKQRVSSRSIQEKMERLAQAAQVRLRGKTENFSRQTGHSWFDIHSKSNIGIKNVTVGPGVSKCLLQSCVQTSSINVTDISAEINVPVSCNYHCHQQRSLLLNESSIMLL